MDKKLNEFIKTKFNTMLDEIEEQVLLRTSDEDEQDKVWNESMELLEYCLSFYKYRTSEEETNQFK